MTVADRRMFDGKNEDLLCIDKNQAIRKYYEANKLLAISFCPYKLQGIHYFVGVLIW